MAGHWFFFKKMAATREKFKNLRCEIDCLAKGYKRAIDELRGPLAKMDSWSKIRIYGPKKRALLAEDHVLATTGQSCAIKKVPFSQINISLLADFGCYFGKNRIFGPFSAFRQSVKTAVYGHFSVILAGTGSVYQRGSYYRWPGWSHQVSLTSVQN